MSTDAVEVFKFKGKPHPGKSSGKATSFEPGQVLPTAPAFDEVEALDRPRPAKTRYPIDLRRFELLEAKAAKIKIRPKKDTEITHDKGSKKELALSPGMAAPAG